LKAGAYGVCPRLQDEKLSMMILPDNKFAILMNEKHFQEFDAEVQKHPEIQTIYIVTDSEAGYREMIAGYGEKDTYQLYRDYLDNFRINTGR
jgi:adenine-specific DNA-methyltransferase